MTLIDIKNALLSHFLGSSTFTVPDDLGIIKLDRKESGDDFIENKEDIIRYGLEDLVKLGLLAKVKDGLYVLTQPLNNLNQTVVITPVTALMVADLVNSFTKQTGEQQETGHIVNKLSIVDYDIASLCRICHTILSSDGDDGGDEDEDDPKGSSKQGRN